MRSRIFARYRVSDVRIRMAGVDVDGCPVLEVEPRKETSANPSRMVAVTLECGWPGVIILPEESPESAT